MLNFRHHHEMCDRLVHLLVLNYLSPRLVTGAWMRVKNCCCLFLVTLVFNCRPLRLSTAKQQQMPSIKLRLLLYTESLPRLASNWFPPIDLAHTYTHILHSKCLLSPNDQRHQPKSTEKGQQKLVPPLQPESKTETAFSEKSGKSVLL